MFRRFAFIWFPRLLCEWHIRKNPALKKYPVSIFISERGKDLITDINIQAERAGITTGMAITDAKALCPSLHAFKADDEQLASLLNFISEWCIRYTPLVTPYFPDGVWLDITGCAHLFGGEKSMLNDIFERFKAFGYGVKISISDTPGSAWAHARYYAPKSIVSSANTSALMKLPPAALRLDGETAHNLKQVGIKTIADLITVPRPSLSKRFGQAILLKIDQTLGTVPEILVPKYPEPDYTEELNFFEPVSTTESIEFALRKLLEKLCARLSTDQKGARQVALFSYRVDGKVERIEIGTALPSKSPAHLFKLFGEKIPTIKPGFGIELFALCAFRTEKMLPSQKEMADPGQCDEEAVSELVDTLRNKIGRNKVYRFLPRQSYWPDRYAQATLSITEPANCEWNNLQPRPIQVLTKPEPIKVTALIPDYPPVSFQYKGEYHKIVNSEGPERIEAEWWIGKDEFRDYYRLEDEHGQRYWAFRRGHYNAEALSQWFLHGFFG